MIKVNKKNIRWLWNIKYSKILTNETQEIKKKNFTGINYSNKYIMYEELNYKYTNYNDILVFLDVYCLMLLYSPEKNKNILLKKY